MDQAFLRSHPLFAHANEAALAALTPQAIRREWRPRQVLFRRGDREVGLILILRGRVRVLRERAGRRQLVHAEGAGGSLGEIPVLDGGAMVATGIASEPTEGIVLHRHSVRAALVEDPVLAWKFLERVAARVRHLADRLEDATFNGVSMRLATVLLERDRLAGGRAVTFGMSQSHLAEELGTVREVIVRELRSLVRKEVLVARGQGRYLVNDLSQLEAIANGR